MDIAFHEFKPEWLPLTVELVHPDGTVVWSTVIDGPGALVVPALPGPPLHARLTFPDGHVIEAEAP